MRKLNGVERPLPASVYGIDGTRMNLTLVPDPQADTLPTNKIDSIYVQCAIRFTSGCENFKRVLIRTFPNFDTTEVDGICRGETYRWNPSGSNIRSFTDNTDPKLVYETLTSQPGCDSIVRLKLTSIELMMPSSHLILCCPLLLLPSILPSIRVFSNESALCIRWPNIGISASTSVLPMIIQD